MALNNNQSMIVPTIYSKKGTGRPEQVGGEKGLPNTGNTFNAYTFVVLTAGVLAAVATAGVSSCGLVLDPSNTDTVVNPPTDFFAGNHFPLTLNGQRFAVSVTDSSGHVGSANGAPQASAITLGSKYGLIRLSNGNHALNVSDTTNFFFQVVELPSKWNLIPQDSTTYNPVVIVEIVSTVIQAV